MNAAFLEKLARAQKQVASEGHKDADALRIRAEKNEGLAKAMRAKGEV
jgi:hypothetical protein